MRWNVIVIYFVLVVCNNMFSVRTCAYCRTVCVCCTPTDIVLAIWLYLVQTGMPSRTKSMCLVCAIWPRFAIHCILERYSDTLGDNTSGNLVQHCFTWWLKPSNPTLFRSHIASPQPTLFSTRSHLSRLQARTSHCYCDTVFSLCCCTQSLSLLQ
jgi:hypothetical protein